MERRSVSSGTAWEKRFGYARAVRIGPFVWTSGTLPVNDQGDVLHPDSAYQQMLAALAKIERALVELGARREHVVRTRMFVTQHSAADEVGRAHAEFFGDIRPAATMVEIKGLAAAAALVEVEVEAFVPEPEGA